MENSLIQQFTNNLFGNVRVVIDDKGEPWFVGSEIASVLGYKNPSEAVKDHVFLEYKINVPSKMLGTLTGSPNIILINEAGLYQLIFTSKLPSAKAFANWVYSEVLPTMRKIGFDRSIQLLHQEVSRLQSNNEVLQIENSSLRNDNANYSELLYENSDLNSRLEGCGCIIQDLQEEVMDLKQEIKENKNV